MGKAGGKTLLTALLVSQAWAGHVEWSDGRRQEGTLQAGPNGTVRLHDGARVREWPLEGVSRVVFRPEKERLERAWRFVEAGQTRKEEWGDPFPVAELTADVWLADGGRVSGHLLSTVVYLQTAEGTEKIVVKHKLRGQPGEGMDALAYPAELVFGAADAGVGGRAATVRLEGNPPCELAAVSRETMNTAAVAPAADDGWRVALEGGDAVVALRAEERIRVGWRGACDAAVTARIAQGLTDLKDFFDGRELLACAIDPADATVCHTLLLLHRKGATTLASKASQPWRLEVWRWRLGEGDDISAARRAVLFRGILAPKAPLPQVVLDAGLAKTERLTADVRLETDADAFEARDAEAGQRLQPAPGAEVDRDRGIAVADHIHVAGVAELPQSRQHSDRFVIGPVHRGCDG